MRGLVAIAALTAASSAWAQDEPIVVEGDLVVTSGLADGSGEADVDGRLRVTGSTLVIPGVELGVSGGLRLDGDRFDRRAAGGRYSSLTLGGSRGVGAQGSDVFIDRSYIFARGGFGSLSVGAQEGVASQLAVTSPTIFRALGVNDWRADPTRLNDVNTVNDFSGVAPKVTYMPPSGFLGGIIGNVQMGVSYAPELDTCGQQGCQQATNGTFVLDPNGNAVLQDQRWRDVSEAALYYQHGVRLGRDRLVFGLGASFVHAEEEQVAGMVEDSLLDDYEALALGLNLAYGDLTFGGSVKSTNTGIDENAAGGPSDYLAFDAGVTYTAGDWKMMLGYGQADAERDASLLIGPAVNVTLPFALDRRTQTAQAGIAYVIGRGVTLGAAAQFVDSDKPDVLGGDEDTTAVMIESSIRF
ncbi:MAG: porin [Pseudomonadota bacterium]